MVWAIGGLPKCPKFIRIGDTSGGCWLLLITMTASTQKYVQYDHIFIVVHINGVCYRGVFRNVPNSRAVVTLFKAVGYCWLLLSLLLGVFRNVPNLGAVVRLFDSDWLLLIWSYIITKAWSVDHTIIVIYINGVCYEGTSRGPRGPKNTEYLSLYNRCASRICTLWL